MRTPILFALLSALVGCGEDTENSPDAGPDPGNRPPPRVIAGGGIGDGAIDGVVNLYVIDDTTRMPIQNAAVRVGTMDGTTDAEGLFVAEGITGPQTVSARASGFRAEVWIGVNGANVTLNLAPANLPTPPSADLAGEITGFANIAVPAGHAKVALVSYSQSVDLGDPANEIAQPNSQNVCIVLGAQACNFVVTSRTGRVALLAAIYDRDLNGTPMNPADDTSTLIGWAFRSGITVVAGSAQTNVDLAQIAAGNLQQLTVDFGSPPSGLPNLASLVGIEAGDDGVIQLIPELQTLAANTLLAPKPSAFSGGTSYRLTGIASDGATTNPAQSIVLRRGQAGPSLSAGEWLAPPTPGTLTRTGGSWTPTAGATVHSLELSQGSTRIVNLTVFDGSTTATVPDLITLPSGAIDLVLNAIGAPGLDVANFSLDADRDKLVMVGGRAMTLN